MKIRLLMKLLVKTHSMIQLIINMENLIISVLDFFF